MNPSAESEELTSSDRMQRSDDVALHARSLHKAYGKIQANKDVSLTVRKGEVHAVVGENGAGKSTLMNILYGHCQPDRGELTVEGKTQEFRSPHDARECGIGMVHQHFTLVKTLSVAENVVLGMDRSNRVILRKPEIHRRVHEVSDRLGWEFDLKATVESLSVEARQRVEILKVLAASPRIILFDEPTALLAQPEIESFLDIVRRLRAEGASLVLVTHKLSEVMAVADRVTVMRDGQVVWTRDASSVDSHAVAEALTGGLKAPAEVVREHPVGSADEAPVLAVDDLVVAGAHGRMAVNELSTAVGAGVIVGVAGVEGNGQTELFQALSGTIPSESGTVRLHGRDVTKATISERRGLGMGTVPADRRGAGLLPGMTVAENLVFGRLHSDGGAVDDGFNRWRPGRWPEDVNHKVAELMEDYDVRPRHPDALAGSLSGGNQQKVLVARELSRSPSCLLAANPTWGLDLGARAVVHDRIRQAAANGCAVLMFSLEFEEVLELADRILVMYRGRMVLSGARGDLKSDEVAHAMVGG